MTKREKIYISIEKSNSFPSLHLEAGGLIYCINKESIKEIHFEEITRIIAKPINRIYNPSVGFLKDGVKGFMMHRNSGVASVYFNYYIDFDIYVGGDVLLYESNDLQLASQFLLELANSDVFIEDEIGLIRIFEDNNFKQAKDIVNKNYKKWAKKYSLENPRTTFDSSMKNFI